MRQLSKDLVISAEKTIRFFESNMLSNGSYGERIIDISCYYKSPIMFLLANKIDKAMQILDYTKTNFMRVDGDFLNVDSIKTINPVYSEFWTYTNGWLVRAAQQLGREDITKLASIFLDYTATNESYFIT